MSIEYRDHFPWSINIASLAGHLERELAFRPDKRPTFPPTNIGVIREANEAALAAYDQETERLALRARAAREGALLLDPEDQRIPLVAMDRNLQKWRSEATREGKLLSPENYRPSIHGWSKEATLMVKRGEPSGQFGRREPGTSPLGFNTSR